MRCLTPESIRRRGSKIKNDFVTVPCGKCAICQTNRRQDWIIRLYEEMTELHEYGACFVTLTYNDEHNTENLDKVHLQAYIKALRKKVKNKIRYYAIGEYGQKATKRPHYHLIIFGITINSINLLCETWEKGFAYVGDVNIKSISYVAKYHVNKTDFPDGRSPPFALMSKGIGRGYIKKMQKFHDGKTERMFYQFYQWKKRLPRYYQSKLYTPEEIASASENSKEDIYSTELVEEFEKKYPKESYYEYVNQKIQNNEKLFRQKKTFGTSI